MITSRDPIAPAVVGAHYDGLDRWYREIWGEHVHHGLWEHRSDSPETATNGLARRVADLARVAAGSRVVDVGCGYGATARLLARERAAEVIGFTLSAAQAGWGREAATREGVAVELRVSDWLANDLASASVDAVIAIESVSHMPDPGGAFLEAARVLRPGGRLVVCDWLARAERSQWRDRLLLEPICREGRLPAMGTADEYGRLLAAAGLTVESFADESRRVSRTWPICLRRTARKVLSDPEARRFLLSAENPDRIFALTMLRILAAYGTRAMVYGIFSARR
ncbi:MAG: methyltransferase domain-containing protein [Solirubrobacterales bacterium]|nr:methyltransferase domain-containing protein [Solirubrobacterales bacterium]